MSAMPRQRRDSASQRNDAMGHLLTLGEHQAVEVRQAIDSYTNKSETMSFHSRRFAARSHDHIIVAQTRSPLMNQNASKTSAPPSVGAAGRGSETVSTPHH